MSWARTTLTNLAATLAATGRVQWNSDGSYDGTVPGVFIKHVPPTPDGILTLDLTVLSSNPTQAHVLVSLTLRARGDGDSLTAADLLDDLHKRLHGATDVPGFPLVWHQSELDLGRDSNGRDEHTATYHAWTVRASDHATE